MELRSLLPMQAFCYFSFFLLVTSVQVSLTPLISFLPKAQLSYLLTFSLFFPLSLPAQPESVPSGGHLGVLSICLQLKWWRRGELSCLEGSRRPMLFHSQSLFHTSCLSLWHNPNPGLAWPSLPMYNQHLKSARGIPSTMALELTRYSRWAWPITVMSSSNCRPSTI